MIDSPKIKQTASCTQTTPKAITTDEIQFALKKEDWTTLQMYARDGHAEAHCLLGCYYLSSGYGLKLKWAASHFIAAIRPGDEKVPDVLTLMRTDDFGMNEENRSNVIKMLKHILSTYTLTSHQKKMVKYGLASLLRKTDPGESAIIFEQLYQHDTCPDSWHALIDLLCDNQAAQIALGRSKTEYYLKNPYDEGFIFNHHCITGKQAFAYAELCANDEYRLLRDGLFGSQYKTALAFYQEAERWGNKLAGFKCGEMWALMYDSPWGLYSVGKDYLYGVKEKDVPIDKAKAKKYLTMAAKKGDVDAKRLIREFKDEHQQSPEIPIHEMSISGHLKANELRKMVIQNNTNDRANTSFSQPDNEAKESAPAPIPIAVNLMADNPLPGQESYDLAIKYLQGTDDVKRNLLEGLHELKKAAEAGHENAIEELNSTDPSSVFFSAFWEERENQLNARGAEPAADNEPR